MALVWSRLSKVFPYRWFAEGLLLSEYSQLSDLQWPSSDLHVPFQCKENGGNIDTFIWQSDGRHVPLGKQQWNNLEVRIRKVGQAWSECGPVLEQQTLARLLRLSGTPCMQTDRVNGGAEDVVVFWISYTWQLSVKCWSWIVMTRLSNRLHTVTWRVHRHVTCITFATDCLM